VDSRHFHGARPHSPLDCMTPNEFVVSIAARVPDRGGSRERRVRIGPVGRNVVAGRPDLARDCRSSVKLGETR